MGGLGGGLPKFTDAKNVDVWWMVCRLMLGRVFGYA